MTNTVTVHCTICTVNLLQFPSISTISCTKYCSTYGLALTIVRAIYIPLVYFDGQSLSCVIYVSVMIILMMTTVGIIVVGTAVH